MLPVIALDYLFISQIYKIHSKSMNLYDFLLLLQRLSGIRPGSAERLPQDGSGRNQQREQDSDKENPPLVIKTELVAELLQISSADPYCRRKTYDYGYDYDPEIYFHATHQLASSRTSEHLVHRYLLCIA